MSTITPKQLQPIMYNLKGWIRMVEPEQLKASFEQSLKEADFNILGCNEQHFPLNGYTAFWILAESHLAIHTFSESGWCYFELSSCNEAKTKLFKAGLNQLTSSIKWEKEIEVLNC